MLGLLLESKSKIRQGVDGFAFEGIDGAGIFSGVLESGVTEKGGDSLFRSIPVHFSGASPFSIGLR